MPETISVQSGSLVARVCLQGAWLEALTFNGRDVLYPKSIFTLEDGSVKLRGGCHVCLPNFGPGGDSGLAQHGFGRELPWQVSAQTDDSVELLLVGGSDTYAGLESRLTYLLQEKMLCVRLQLTNNGKVPLRVSPGFHPYFQTDDKSVRFDDRELPADQPYDTEFLADAPTTIGIGDYTYTVASENLSQWVAWTDHLDTYFCVEPTQAGYAFLNPPTDDLVAAGESREWSLKLSVY